MSKSSAKKTGPKPSEPTLFDLTAFEIIKKAILIEPPEHRLTTTLKDPSAQPNKWGFYVPSCFNEALDIQLTDRVINENNTDRIWTQGGNFAFSEGDTLYSTVEAYQKWREALTKIEYGVQVKSSSPVTWTWTGRYIETIGRNGQIYKKKEWIRNQGFVAFAILRSNPGRTKLLEQKHQTMSQDDFVRFLIMGPE